jgi:osmotically-inducible protein OsmY
MRVLLALIIGVIIGAAAIWYAGGGHKDSHVQQAQDKVQDAAKSVGNAVQDTAKSARDSVQDKMHDWHLGGDDIKDELAKTGTVIRRKAQDAGKALADATADARITAAIKGKLVASKELSALDISVNTTSGTVTLSGTVTSTENISKAMALAMETDGVNQVISTLQVKPK